MLNNTTKINNVVILNNKNNIKKYNNVNLTIEQVLNKLKNTTNNKNSIKKLENFVFKYTKKYNNLEEKLLENKELRKIFLEEFNKLTEELTEEEKEFLQQQTKQKLNKFKTEEIDYTNPINFLYIQLPALLLNNATKTLFIFSNNFFTQLKQNYIKSVAEQLNINLEEVEKKELEQFLKEQEENLKNLKGKRVEELLNNNLQQQENNEITQLKQQLKQLQQENKELKQENKQLKILSKKLIKQAEKLEQNLELLDNFVERELIQTIYNYIHTNKLKEKEELKKQLEQQLKYKPTFTQYLSM